MSIFHGVPLKNVSRGIKIHNPNAPTIKKNEIGYVISVRCLSKEGFHNLVARAHTSMLNVDSKEQKLLCSGKGYQAFVELSQLLRTE